MRFSAYGFFLYENLANKCGWCILCIVKRNLYQIFIVNEALNATEWNALIHWLIEFLTSLLRVID